jgi:hypothetical protein
MGKSAAQRLLCIVIRWRTFLSTHLSSSPSFGETICRLNLNHNLFQPSNIRPQRPPYSGSRLLDVGEVLGDDVLSVGVRVRGRSVVARRRRELDADGADHRRRVFLPEAGLGERRDTFKTVDLLEILVSNFHREEEREEKDEPPSRPSSLPPPSPHPYPTPTAFPSLQRGVRHSRR